MSYPRTGITRRIRVGESTGVNVRVLPTIPGGGRLGTSRHIRVWGSSGGVCTADQVEDFGRVIAESLSGGWGTGDLGAWSRIASTVNTYAGVDGASAISRWAADPSPSDGRVVDCVLPDAAWTTPLEFLTRVTRTQVANSELDMYLVAAGNDGALDDYIRCESGMDVLGDATLTIQVETGGESLGDSATVSRSLTTGQAQLTRWRIESTVMRAKMWAASDAEPASWDVVLTYPAGTLTGLFASAHVRAKLWSHLTGETYFDDLTLICNAPFTGALQTVTGRHGGYEWPVSDYQAPWFLPFTWTPPPPDYLFTASGSGNANSIILNDCSGIGTWPSGAVTATAAWSRPGFVSFDGTFVLYRNGVAVASEYVADITAVDHINVFYYPTDLAAGDEFYLVIPGCPNPGYTQPGMSLLLDLS